VTPELVICPLCGRDSLEIYRDSSSNGDGKWLRCFNCRFGGDAIELYGYMRKIKDVRATILEVFSRGLADIPANRLDPADIEAYVADSYDPRRKLNDIWASLSELTPHQNPVLLKRAQEEHLWLGWHSSGHERIRKVMGVGTRSRIRELFDKSILPASGFDANLVVNYQDIPGRICGFGFLGDNSEQNFKLFNGEGGLAMLDGVRLYEKTVYAVRNPRLALRLHGQWLMNFREPLKLVLFNEKTSGAWSNVFAKKVIFWDDHLNRELFEQARLLGPQRGYVALKPTSRFPLDEAVDGYFRGVDAILPLMEKHGYPWPEALIRWVTEKRELDEARLDSVTSKMSFDKLEREALVDAAPPKYKKEIDRFFRESRLSKSVVINGTEVTENESGWWAASKKGKELISEASVRILKEITDSRTGKTYWEGEIRCGGKDIPFSDAAKTVEKNPKEWLTGKIAGSGCPYPTVKPNWVRYVPVMAQQFSLPKQVSASSSLGLSASGKIRFPHVLIDPSLGFVNRAMEIVDPEAPGKTVAAPSRYSHHHINDRAVRALWGALVSVFVSDFVIGPATKRKDGCLVPSLQGGTARRALIRLAEVMDMRRFEIRTGSADEIREIREAFGSFNYPSLAEPLRSGLLNRYPASAGSADRVFLLCGRLEATALSVSDRPWTMIDDSSVVRSDYRFPDRDDVMLFLQKLQKTSFALDKSLPPVLAAAKAWSSWCDERRGRTDKGRFEEISKILRKSPSAGVSAIELCGLLYRDRRPKIIDRDHVPFVERLAKTGSVPSDPCILIDDAASAVFVNLTLLKDAIAHEKLPMPDFDAATTSLMDDGFLKFRNVPADGWIIDRNKWSDVLTSLASRFSGVEAEIEKSRFRET